MSDWNPTLKMSKREKPWPSAMYDSNTTKTKYIRFFVLANYSKALGLLFLKDGKIHSNKQ